MIVCSCNALSDRAVRTAIADGACRPAEIYAACGRRAQCGNCAPTILCLLRDAVAHGLAAAAPARAAAA